MQEHYRNSDFDINISHLYSNKNLVPLVRSLDILAVGLSIVVISEEAKLTAHWGKGARFDVEPAAAAEDCASTVPAKVASTNIFNISLGGWKKDPLVLECTLIARIAPHGGY